MTPTPNPSPHKGRGTHRARGTVVVLGPGAAKVRAGRALHEVRQGSFRLLACIEGREVEAKSERRCSRLTRPVVGLSSSPSFTFMLPGNCKEGWDRPMAIDVEALGYPSSHSRPESKA